MSSALVIFSPLPGNHLMGTAMRLTKICLKVKRLEGPYVPEVKVQSVKSRETPNKTISPL